MRSSQIIVWDVAAARTVLRCFTLPASLPGARGVVSLAWAANSRVLFAVTQGGLLVAVDAASGAVLRALQPPYPVRFVKPHPLCGHLLLLVPWVGMPWLLQWAPAPTAAAAVVGGDLSGSSSESERVDPRAPAATAGSGGNNGTVMHAGLSVATATASSSSSSSSALPAVWHDGVAIEGGDGDAGDGDTSPGGEGWAWRVPETVLPPPKRVSAAASAGAGGGKSSSSSSLASSLGARGISGDGLRCDACWHSGHGCVLYVTSSRGDLTALRLSVVEDALAGVAARVTGGGGSSGSGSGLAPSRSAGPPPPPPPLTAYRLSHAYTAAPLPLPEVRHSRAHGFVSLVSSKAGVVLHADSGSLAATGRGYADPVDNTPLTHVRFSPGDRYILTLPYSTSGHLAGCLAVFTRGSMQTYRLRAGPPGGVSAMEVHPTVFMVAGITSRGTLHVLQAPCRTSFYPGPMFPPGFNLITSNRGAWLRADWMAGLGHDGGATCCCLHTHSRTARQSPLSRSLTPLACCRVHRGGGRARPVRRGRPIRAGRTHAHAGAAVGAHW
jgi:hypothetical protein